MDAREEMVFCRVGRAEGRESCLVGSGKGNIGGEVEEAEGQIPPPRNLSRRGRDRRAPPRAPPPPESSCLRHGRRWQTGDHCCPFGWRARTQGARGAADGRARNGAHFRPKPVPLEPSGTARFIPGNLVSSVATARRDGWHKDPTVGSMLDAQ